MAGRGVHFAVTAARAKELLAARTDRQLMKLVDALEEAWDEPHLVESDMAWEPIHRCLTDGTLLYESGEYPLNHCICGGKQLHRGGAYTVSFVAARQVKDVAKALAKLTKPAMRKRYAQIDSDEYPTDDEDFEYAWENLLDIRRFYKRAAESGRAVIFTVDA
jgi:hypothetical protein